MATLSITQLRSSNGSNPKQRDTLRTLGRIGKRSERADSPALRGALHSVRHLVKVDG